MTKVYGNSGQWCGLDIGNCYTRVIGILVPSLTSVIIFVIYFLGRINLHTVAFLSLSLTHWTACPKPVRKVALGSDLSQSLASEARFWSHNGPCRIYGRQIRTETGFLPISHSLVFPTRYHSTNPVDSFICRWRRATLKIEGVAK